MKRRLWSSSDYMKSLANRFVLSCRRRITCWAPTGSAAAIRGKRYGTHFEVDIGFVTLAALKSLADAAEDADGGRAQGAG